MDKYDTKLSREDEVKYQVWKNKNAPNDSGEDYDLRGAYKEGMTRSSNNHLSDKYKKPNHPTFSDESKYAKDAPEKAGHWTGKNHDRYVPPIHVNVNRSRKGEE